MESMPYPPEDTVQKPEKEIKILHPSEQELENARQYFKKKDQEIFLHKFQDGAIESDRSQYTQIVANILTERLNDPKMATLFQVAANAIEIPQVDQIRDSVVNSRRPLSSLSEIDHQVVLGIIKALQEDRIAAAEWVRILDDYEHLLNNCREWLKTQESKLKHEFLQLFMEKINPDLTSPKSAEELAIYLNQIEFTFTDPLSSSATASYSGVPQLIILRDTLLISKILAYTDECDDIESTEEYRLMQHILNHEMLHAVSENSPILVFKTKIKNPDSSTKINNNWACQWTGVQINSLEKTQFSWLNEAITETLNAKLLDTPPSAYPQEITLLKLVMEKGVIPLDFKLFIDAYFEKKDIQSGTSESKPDVHVYWKKLIEAIRKAYPEDPQFLPKIDRYIGEHGIDAAIHMLEEWKPGESYIPA